MKGKSHIQAAVLTALLILCVCLMTACGSSSSGSEPSSYGERVAGSAETVSTAEDDSVPAGPEEAEAGAPEEEPEEEMEAEETVEEPAGLFEQIQNWLASGSSDSASGSAIQFTEDWYKTYTFFEDETGNELEMAWFTFDSGYASLTAFVNQSAWVNCEATDYTETADGGYQYVDEDDARISFIYYPAESKVIVNAIPDSYIFYCNSDAGESLYAAAEAEEISQDVTYYLTDRVYGDVFAVVPHHVSVTSSSSGGYTKINVYCSVANLSDSPYIFYGTYLTMNNQGVIVSGRSDYDNMTIAAGGGFDGMITFSYPYGANTNTSLMSMTFADQTIFLSAKPQYGDDWYTVEGTYRLLSNNSMEIVVEKSGSTYIIFDYSSFFGLSIYISDFVDNVLTIDGHSYKYDEDQATLYCSFSQQTWSKINPH